MAWFRGHVTSVRAFQALVNYEVDLRGQDKHFLNVK